MLFVLFICMLCGIGGFSAGAQTLGDVNGSGVVDIVDALLVAQYYVGLNPQNFNSAYADVDCSGSIDVVDALLLARLYVGLITQFPCTTTPAPTPASNSGVLFIGRFETSDSAGPKFGWSATTIKASFRGTEVSVKLSSTGDNWFNVIVDGTVRTPVNAPSGANGTYLLASGLSSGSHTIELVKRTEASQGDTQFFGFTYGSGTQLAAQIRTDLGW